MPAPARIWEYGDYWIGRVANSDYYYACWWDQRAKRTRRRSLDTKILEEARDRLIALAGIARRDVSRSPDSVMLIVALNHYYENDINKPSSQIAFRAIQLISEFVGEKIGPASTVSAFSQVRRRRPKSSRPPPDKKIPAKDQADRKSC